MNMEQKLAYIQKALEMGAQIEVKFHGVQSESAAKEIISELQPMTIPFKRVSANGKDRVHYWYNAEDYENKVESTIYFRGEEGLV